MGIYFDGTNEYTMKLYDIYSKILKNEAGQVIVEGIRDTGKDLVFMPRTGRDAETHVCNADTYVPPSQREDRSPYGVSKLNGNYYHGDDDDPDTPEDERYIQVNTGRIGTGKGVDVTIYFSPDDYYKSKCNHGGPGAQVDDVLHHEMVHALRSMQGQFNPIPTKNKDYDTDEEFLAIVATNVYISAKGGTRFRAGHHGYKLLNAPLNTSSGFIDNKDNWDLMNIYRLSWDRIFAGLSMVASATFNPFRELVVKLAYQTEKTAAGQRANVRWHPNRV
ncbi:MAG TPA: M91 family zinc metallopeptidase [Bryobacteraceae bacterium]|jgi:hypothetical protein